MDDCIELEVRDTADLDSSPGARNIRRSLPPGEQGAGGCSPACHSCWRPETGEESSLACKQTPRNCYHLACLGLPMHACLPEPACLPACVWPCRSLGVTGSRSCCSRCRATTQRWSDWRGGTKSEAGCMGWSRQRQLPAGAPGWTTGSTSGGGTSKGQGSKVSCTCL